MISTDDFLGKRAIVTGAANGIGKATALALLHAGAKVALIDIDLKGLQEFVQALNQSIREDAIILHTDISKNEEVEGAVKRTVDSFGGIDLIVNNAGVAILTKMVTVKLEDWDLVLNTNLRGTFLCSRAVLPYMLRQQSGNIVNVASIDGLKGRSGGAAYCASKAGIIRFTESFADEVARFGIRVNVVCPAGVNTTMWRKSHAQADPRSVLQPKEVADTILFLASDASKALNGATLELLGPRLESGTYL